MGNLARVGRKFELNSANSSQVGGRTIPNSIEVVNLARVGRTVWPWLNALAKPGHIVVATLCSAMLLVHGKTRQHCCAPRRHKECF